MTQPLIGVLGQNGQVVPAALILAGSLAQLANVNPNTGTGTTAQVADQGVNYVLDRANTFAADGFWILAANGGGNWFRRSKAHVVSQSFCWVCPFGGNVPNDNQLFGYGPGAQAAGAAVEEIRIDLRALTAADSTNVVNVIVDSLGNLWAFAFGASNALGVAYKINLSDCLATGVPVPDVTVRKVGPGNAQVSGAFDKTNAFWTACNAGTNQYVKYAATAIAPSGTTTAQTPDIIVSQNPVAVVTSADPEFLCFDAEGNLWVSCFGTGAGVTTGCVLVLTAAQLAATATVSATAVWSGSNFKGPQGLAFSPLGVLWVANYSTGGAASFVNSHVPQAPATGNQAAVVHLTGINGTTGLAFDRSGNLWVVSADDKKTYKLTPAQLAASGAVVPTISLGNSVGAFPQAVAFPNDPTRSGLVAAGAPASP